MANLALVVFLHCSVAFLGDVNAETVQDEEETGLLVVGGEGARLSAVLWSPSTGLCSLPDLPHEMVHPTVDMFGGVLRLCHGMECFNWMGGGWTSWKNTSHYRHYHTSATAPSGLYLVGGVNTHTATGKDSPVTTEVLPAEGEGRDSFTLPAPGKELHCSIQVDETTIILTGGTPEGMKAETGVFEYAGLGQSYEDSGVSMRELPSLIHPRFAHACGQYLMDNTKVLIVVGGYDDTYLDSTEVMDYTALDGSWRDVSSMKWREVTPMPSPKNGVRGASVGGIFHVAGGNSDYSMQGFSKDILAWDPVAETWQVTGQLEQGRVYAGVTQIPISIVAPYCTF